MGKLSRYDAGEIPEDRKKRTKAPRRVVKKVDEPAVPKKQRSLSLRIRDVRRLMERYKDEESQKRLSERLSRMLRRSEYKAQQRALRGEEKIIEDKSRKAKIVELKKLETRLKKTSDDEIRNLMLNDIEYIKGYPVGTPYISLFDNALSDAEKSKRDELRKQAALRRMNRADLNAEDDLDDDFFQSGDEST
jgi:hypothetical protein